MSQAWLDSAYPILLPELLLYHTHIHSLTGEVKEGAQSASGYVRGI